MGKEAKLKAQRRSARAAQRLAEEEAKAAALINPPDLGISVNEVIDTKDKFGG